MIDHLLSFDSAVAAATALQPLGLASLTGDIPLFGPAVFLNTGGADNGSLRVILPFGVLQPGWHCIVERTTIDPALRDLPGDACRLITDRDLAAAGDASFRLYLAQNMDPALLSTARVRPTLAGPRYPFSAS
jgi:hypothetical protein